MSRNNRMGEFMEDDENEEKQDENEKVELRLEKKEHCAHQQYEGYVQFNWNAPNGTYFKRILHEIG